MVSFFIDYIYFICDISVLTLISVDVINVFIHLKLLSSKNNNFIIKVINSFFFFFLTYLFSYNKCIDYVTIL